MRDEDIIKTCGCGRRYTLATWAELPWIGDHVDEEERIELRNCACKSTIGLVVLYLDADTRFYECDVDTRAHHEAELRGS